MSRAVQQILEKGEHEALGRRLSYSACLPTTSTCYTRLFFEKYGYFDENYVLIEDYPVHLRIVQEKIPVLYENFVAIHHRSGGISHGATKALSASKRQYFRDIVGCHEQVLQGLKKERTKFSKAVRDEFRHQKIWLDYQIFWRSPSWAETVSYTHLLKKVYIPKYIFPVSRVLSSFVTMSSVSYTHLSWKKSAFLPIGTRWREF